MTPPGVLLRLTDGPALEAWLASAAAVEGPRWLELVGEEERDVADVCRRYDISPATPDGPVVTVVADAADMPTPSLVRRLVEALDSNPAVAARNVPLEGPVRCVASRTGTRQTSPPAKTFPWLRRPSSFTTLGLPRRRWTARSRAPGILRRCMPRRSPACCAARGRLRSRAGRARRPVPDGRHQDARHPTAAPRGDRLCLAAQDSTDFEVLLVCHRAEPDDLQRVRALVAAQADGLRERIHVLTVDRPGRSAPLNDALEVARGRYVVILDDDDTVMAGWVTTFATLERAAPGRVLRSLAVRQEVSAEVVDTPQGPVTCPVSQGAPQRVWPDQFSLIDHLHINLSPCMTVAFPRGIFRDLGARYDESLDTTEDWDFLVRAAAIVGVVDSATVTAVYRWWTDGGSSRHEHDAGAWKAHHRAVEEGFDDLDVLLPRGSAADARRVLVALVRARENLARTKDAQRILQERLDDALLAHAVAVRAHDDAVAAHDRAVEWPVRGRKMSTAPRAAPEAQEPAGPSVELLREAHGLLLAGRHDRMLDGQPPFELRGHDLRDFVARLRG